MKASSPAPKAFGSSVSRRASFLRCVRLVAVISAIVSVTGACEFSTGSRNVHEMLSAPVCPANLTAVSDDGLAVDVDYDVPIVQLKDGAATGVCSPPPLSSFEVGSHEVKCAWSDDPEAVCAFSITVSRALVLVGPTMFTVVAGKTEVGTLRASVPDMPTVVAVWSITGGADSAHFTLSVDGGLAFVTAKDYEAPDDADGDGSYELAARASAGAVELSVDVTVVLAVSEEVPANGEGAPANGGADQAPVDVPTGGICNRTLQVRTAIVDLIANMDTCSAVTDDHLSAVTGTLNLNRSGISSLRSGDFAGLTGLGALLLARNELTTLPEDVFAGLDSLRTLRLYTNGLESIPSGLFSGLGALEILDLEFNNLSTLPAAVFDGLNVWFLGLDGNQLETLPGGLFDSLGDRDLILDLSNNRLTTLRPDIFSALDNLVWLDLAMNQLPTLPSGVFDGLTKLNSLYLEDNPGASFTFTMTIERVSGADKVVVVVAEGAPFDMTTTVSASGGALPDGVTTVTVPTGHTRSNEIAVTPLDGATVSLGLQPNVPADFDGIRTAVGGPVTF